MSLRPVATDSTIRLDSARAWLQARMEYALWAVAAGDVDTAVRVRNEIEKASRYLATPWEVTQSATAEAD